MAGGEFRFGTASIYMAKQKPIRFPGTNHQSVITWPRLGQFHNHSAGISAGLIVSTRGKLGLTRHRQAQPAPGFDHVVRRQRGCKMSINSLKFSEHRVPRKQGSLYARDYDGAGPAFVLMHG